MHSTEEHKMSPEIQEKLFGLLPMKKDAEHSFVPSVFTELEVPEEFCPEVAVRQLTEEEGLELKTAMGLSLGASIKAEETSVTKNLLEKIAKCDARMFNVVRQAIVGWTNMRDIQTGVAIPYSEEAKSELPVTILGHILAEVMKITGMKIG